MEILYSFRESKRFTNRILKIMSDEDYAEFQSELIDSPQVGQIIKGSGGIRKVRWATKGKGKRGGLRIIYYFAIGKEIIFLLDVYAKNEKEDLSPFELKSLKKLVTEWLENG